MPSASDEHSRVLGGLVCLGAVLGTALFLYGVSLQSYWALALPVGALLLFLLALVFWIGWTIATVRIEAEGEPLSPGGGPGSATVSDPNTEPPPGPSSEPR
ncbi:MAG: hypothetical protein ACE5FG_01310 [Myxococcota bacterium]